MTPLALETSVETTPLPEPIPAAIAACIRDSRTRVIDLARDIHALAETAYEEHRSSARIRETLERSHFRVEDVPGFPTAFVARSGPADAPTVALVCEYDALPGLGHACGHNIIAGAGVAAGLALRAGLDAGNVDGQVLVVGAPAEEDGGGKIDLLEAGVFDRCDAAFILHPSDRTTAVIEALACTHWDVVWSGRAAHAASSPDAGLNALDAFVHAWTGIGLWRQQLRDGSRVHGVVNEGGTAANVIPDRVRASFMTRARDHAYLVSMDERFTAICTAAAAATGTTVEVSRDRGYRDIKVNPVLAAVVHESLEAEGMEPQHHAPWESAASTDVGDLSYAVPTVHPEVAVAAPGIRYHTHAFREAANTDHAYAVMLSGAAALARSAAAVVVDPNLREQVRAHFRTADWRRPSWTGSGR